MQCRGRGREEVKREQEERDTSNKGGGRVLSVNLAFTKVLLYLGGSLRSSLCWTELQVIMALLKSFKKCYAYEKNTIQYLSRFLSLISNPQPVPCLVRQHKCQIFLSNKNFLTRLQVLIFIYVHKFNMNSSSGNSPGTLGHLHTSFLRRWHMGLKMQCGRERILGKIEEKG